ncbi:MAG: N-acetyl-alpha-D-glucosaminyl L-malate synthase BshA [Phycisphaeraceae bacterium]
MRILISCHPTQGGSGVVATELAMGLASRGHDMHMAAVERPFRLGDNRDVHFHPVNVTNYPLFKYPPHDLCLANEIAEAIVAHDIQIVHAHYAVPHAIAAILAAQAVQPHPVRVVTTLHGTDITLVGSHRDFYRVCRHAMVQCDGLTTVSQWLLDQTMKEFDLPEPPVVLPNFVDCDRFGPRGRAGWPEDGEFQVLHASNFRPVKRVVDIIRVFERIQRQIPARLVMVGDGPERGLAEELAGELGICDRVRFVGPQTAVEDLYRSSHLFLLLSDYESFGLSALEAQACGVPAVVSDAGGLPEVVRDRVTGRLSPVGDIEKIAQASLDVLGDAEQWAAMSEAAVSHARRTFCRDKILPLYEDFYEQILKQ